MPDVVITSENLGKSYLIGHQSQRERYTALRDVLARQMKQVWGATRRALRGQSAIAGEEIEEFWALRDVSFEVNRGEVVGIIGRNGAGKSTLLKILSRITEPTEGRLTLRGRVASLLEVGTGFHPELTGRENVFLNGAILGMSRFEIKRKFDEIVAFAEVEKFLDTPVKRYSSGMYVRLAFAVAAHLEPEILVVDEVLAVGDAEFQKKCLGKMQEVSRGGRTVLFVSHNMAAIRRLCRRSIVLSSGRVYEDSETGTAVGSYMRLAKTISQFQKVIECKGRDIDFLIQELSIEQNDNNLIISFRLSGITTLPNVGIGVSVTTKFGDEVFKLNPKKTRLTIPRGIGDCSIYLTIESILTMLSSGEYQCSLWFSDVGIEVLKSLPDIGAFVVMPRDVFGTGQPLVYTEDGILAPHATMSIHAMDVCPSN